MNMKVDRINLANNIVAKDIETKVDESFKFTLLTLKKRPTE